ncbi:Rha family transcriptional regulator [Campylobacter hyointestinalis]|uniref:Rha family transcriptional regulator n=1 Tax=Campylobacter hyointestinalis TaxID=198 RepID=UPI00215C694E|nr:Rha family transcriptional regulator [Campylobacter hyointestinalis]
MPLFSASSKRNNFKESFYLNKQSRKQSCYNLTSDSFSLLVMGFTKQKSYGWKIEFIKAFNLIELTRFKFKKQSSQSPLNLYFKFHQRK